MVINTEIKAPTGTCIHTFAFKVQHFFPDQKNLLIYFLNRYTLQIVHNGLAMLQK